jgi:CubicO group peptidase (beta-lactamase class C family)
MKRKAIYLMLVFSFAICLFSSCEVARCIIYNVVDVNDYKIFPYRITKADDAKFCFAPNDCQDEKRIPVNILTSDDRKIYFDQFLEQKKTLAFLVIQNDTMVYEKYFNECNQTSIIPSFSIAKSITSTLIGCAIDDGYITSVDQPVTDYIPELKRNGFEKVTIKHLLQMTSSINFKEYFYFSNSTPAYYYGTNLRAKVHKLKLRSEPGKKFEYSSGNTELLGLILEKALKTKTLTQYLEEKIWQPLGMEYNASWSLDQKRNGIEKTFCCLNARARDYAKLGRLYLNNGNWNGNQIVSESWIKESVKIDTTNGSVWFYQYQWWLASDEGDYYAKGMLGQILYVNPSKKLIIVRLGERSAGVNWSEICRTIAAGFDVNMPYDISFKNYGQAQ